MPTRRALVVVADDYGIGPETSAGILQAAQAGVVTGTVLLVNSPFAADAVTAWQAARVSADLGWHPCLTIDRPVSAAERVPSLVDRNGYFRTLGGLMARLATGRIRYEDVVTELTAQLQCFRELTGRWPDLVNAHHHVQVFHLIGAALRQVLGGLPNRPYLRRVCEPWRALTRVPGARAKRLFLSRLGYGQARHQERSGYPGAEWLAGITDPACVHDEQFFCRWLRQMPGPVVELTCHPGHHDVTLLGRDATASDGQLERRVRELELLLRTDFAATVKNAGFRLIPASRLVWGGNRVRRAA